MQMVIIAVAAILAASNAVAADWCKTTPFNLRNLEDYDAIEYCLEVGVDPNFLLGKEKLAAAEGEYLLLARRFGVDFAKESLWSNWSTRWIARECEYYGLLLAQLECVRERNLSSNECPEITENECKAERVDVLLRLGLDPGEINPDTQQSPISSAIDTKNLPLATVLLNHGAKMPPDILVKARLMAPDIYNKMLIVQSMRSGRQPTKTVPSRVEQPH